MLTIRTEFHVAMGISFPAYVRATIGPEAARTYGSNAAVRMSVRHGDTPERMMHAAALALAKRVTRRDYPRMTQVDATTYNVEI